MSTIFNFIIKKQVIGPIITIIVAYILYKILELTVSKISFKTKNELERKRRTTIVVLVQNIIKYLIFIIALLIILEIYGVNTKSLIAGLGIMGIVIGLALQDTLKDLIAGINIIMDNYYVVGDIVEYNGFKGEVILLGLRSTKIKRNSGEVLTFANRNISSVINYSQRSAQLWYEISTPSDIPIQIVEKKIISLIPEIEKLSNVKQGQVEYIGINSIANATIQYAINIGCERNTQNGVKMQVNKLIKEEFDKSKIAIK